MDLKDRLKRLTSFSRTGQASQSQVLSDLRERLDRLLEPKRVYRKKWVVPIEQLIEGETLSTPDGETFQAQASFPADFHYGEMTLS